MGVWGGVTSAFSGMKKSPTNKKRWSGLLNFRVFFSRTSNPLQMNRRFWANLMAVPTPNRGWAPNIPFPVASPMARMLVHTTASPLTTLLAGQNPLDFHNTMLMKPHHLAYLQ